MTPATVQTFFALLTIVAFAVVLVVAVARVSVVVRPGTRATFEAASAATAPSAIAMAAIVATLATIGSLYFSEVAGYEPCRLCWFQRIAMYPLTVILWLAVAWRDRTVIPYVVALAGIGAVIAGYHVALEWIPALDTGACGVGPSCSVIWFRVFGLISLPTMALSAFLLIIAVVTLPMRRPRSEHASEVKL